MTKPEWWTLKYERDFYAFVKASWHVLENEFQDNWHIEELCKALQGTSKGLAHNLILCVPPRFGKSRLVNTFFPAFILTTKKDAKFLALSATDDLSGGDLQDCLKLMESKWYQERWPTQFTKRQANRFETTDGAIYMAFGIHSSFTGEGADYLLLDDLVSASKMVTDNELESVNSIYDRAVVSRLNKPETGVKILIMQRLSTFDLVGHLLDREKEDWEVIIFPMRYEKNRFISKRLGVKDHRKKEGELLWPQRFNNKYVKSLELTLGKLNANSQLQQRPTLAEGSIYKKEWFKDRVNNTDIIARWISADTASAIKESNQNAYNAFVVVELTSDYHLFVRWVDRSRLTLPEQHAKIVELANKYKYGLQAIVIESKSSGPSLIQSLQANSEEWIADLLVPFNPVTDKVSRASQASLWAENGTLLLPPDADPSYPWMLEFTKELFEFPNCKFKDQVDSLSQIIIYLEPGYLEVGLRARNNL
jgi:predicted phage terminase large subunit-like protein